MNYYAWFSMKASIAHGYVVCSAADGSDVYATYICDSGVLPDNYKWDDAKYCGVVSKPIRKYPKAAITANQYAAKHGRENRVYARWS